ncbi:hypothetical protein [Desertibacillus haloalkaliphilus]|uniref:hypothetical protein n=1 Tax=Desertibacillus haloalkaliphilus TaxID=1328930 RepID=UPI001C275E6E|nr:hypothetical protein [Desertibacillus haloalkaliphilus]MBU8906942.1 hypothetical protein [Desertibacillus haloalkaliphilus]
MNKNKQWFSLPRRDCFFLIGILLYTIIFFLPWSYEITILNITLVAWAAYLLHVLAPIVGILLIIMDKNQGRNKSEETTIQGS